MLMMRVMVVMVLLLLLNLLLLLLLLLAREAKEGSVGVGPYPWSSMWWRGECATRTKKWGSSKHATTVGSQRHYGGESALVSPGIIQWFAIDGGKQAHY